jgi:septal ring factor EnvC (AmiA/AmiB activator)
MASFDFAAPMGSISPVARRDLQDLYALTEIQLQDSLATLREDLAAVVAWLTTPPETATDDERIDKAATWDEIRQWMATMEAELAKIDDGERKRRSRRQTLLDELRRVEEGFAELENERSTEGTSHSDQAGFDQWENELLAEQNQLMKELKALEAEVDAET